MESHVPVPPLPKLIESTHISNSSSVRTCYFYVLKMRHKGERIFDSVCMGLFTVQYTFIAHKKNLFHILLLFFIVSRRNDVKSTYVLKYISVHTCTQLLTVWKTSTSATSDPYS